MSPGPRASRTRNLCRGVTLQRSAGLTLIELLIVVAVLTIMVMLAVPSFQNARKTAEATKSIGRLKITVTSNEQYSLRFGSYASSMDDLLNSGLVADFDRSPNAAYTYIYTVTGATWALNAAPTIAGVTGDVEFYVDQTGVIRFSTSGPATAASPPVD